MENSVSLWQPLKREKPSGEVAAAETLLRFRNYPHHCQVSGEYLQELCDTLCQVLVTLDVELQLVEPGWQR